MRILRTLLCVTVLTAPTLSAQLNRSAVSVKGLDTNVCTVASPCRSFSHALTQTNPHGEIIALDSGGFGEVFVDRSVTIEAAPGVYAGISGTTFGGSAIEIQLAAPGRVIIRGLTIKGAGGARGIAFGGNVGGLLHVENCIIDGFPFDEGILTFWDAVVSNSVIRNCGEGIYLDNINSPVHAVVDSVTFRNVGGHAVVAAVNGEVTVRNSVASVGVNYGFSAATGNVMNLENCSATGFGIAGVSSHGTGILRISNVYSTDNLNGLYSNAVVETWGNSRIQGNTSSNFNAVPPTVLTSN
jgi:hypothetical protein